MAVLIRGDELQHLAETAEVLEITLLPGSVQANLERLDANDEVACAADGIVHSALIRSKANAVVAATGFSKG